jgi:hypothetical protein
MPEQPQVITIRAGNAEVTLDTATIARALYAIALARPWLHREDVTTLTDTLTHLCSPSHLHAVLHSTTTSENPRHAR